MASFPSPDYWMALPATGARLAVLGRRWTLVASTALAPPHDYWTPVQPDDSAVPILERHWACGRRLPPQTTPTPTASHTEETVTAAVKTSAPLVDRVMLPSWNPRGIPVTVVLTPLDSPPQTVTRLCVGCGKPLEGKRPQAKAHGAACRQRAYRRQKKEAKQAQGQRENGRGSEPEPTGRARTTEG